MYHIALCDDNDTHLTYIQDMVVNATRKMGKTIQTTLFANAEALQQAVQERRPFHLVFCDVELGEKNGISVVKELKRFCPELKVIFISGHLRYNPQAYSVEHLYYLLKPLEEEKLIQALEKAFWALDASAENGPRVAVTSGRHVYRLALGEIMYAESIGRTLKIKTTKEHHSTYLKIEDFNRQLDGRFIQCHKSYIINMEKAQCMETGCFVMQDGASIPISQTRKRKTREAFFSYIGSW